MGIEYKIGFTLPSDYNPDRLISVLPNPIHEDKLQEIYNFSVDEDGFHFVDNLIDRQVASLALRLFLDEALAHTESVQVELL